MSDAQQEDSRDEDLFARFRSGDAMAFDALMQRHRRPIYNLILRSVGEKAVAEDILQDTWLKILQAAPTYDPSVKFMPWAYAIARNFCVDRTRRRVARPQGPGELVGDPGIPVAAEVQDMDAQSKIVSAIEALPGEQREVFVLRELCALRFCEIADVVGAPEDTVRSRMRYALEKLQEALGDDNDTPQALG